MLVTLWVHQTMTLTSQQRIKVQTEVNLNEKYCSLFRFEDIYAEADGAAN